MKNPDSTEWGRIQAYASSNLKDDFASRVVQCAQKEKRMDRQNRAAFAVTYSICLLASLGTLLWASHRSDISSYEAQWQCLHEETEIMRTVL